MKKSFSRFFIFPFIPVLIILVIVFLPFQSYGQAVSSCSNVSDLTNKTEDQLKAYLAQCEKEIADQQKNLDSQQNQSKTIKGDISALTNKINKTQLDIKSKNVVIESLSREIISKNQTINELSSKLQDKLNSLGQLMRKTLELDNTSFVSLVLNSEDLSTFYSDVDSFAYLNKAVKESVDEIKGIKADTEVQKTVLQKDQNSEVDTKVELENSKKKIQQSESEKQKLLNLSKKKEDEYKKYIADQAKKASQIRSALFALRDTAAIPFEQALEYANIASKKTGVRPAFLLAILTQESSLGKNVGSCLMTDLTTGNGKGKNTGTFFERVMKAPRDTEPFRNIMSALGRDWVSTPVSCPIGGTGYYLGRGFGGAMGPAQFIPSTWVMFENRIEGALGIKTADPWRATDAFMASAFYLGDLGASAGGYTAETRAACKYYGSGGGSCTYGTQVMAKVQLIQDNIDFLQGN